MVALHCIGDDDVGDDIILMIEGLKGCIALYW